MKTLSKGITKSDKNKDYSHRNNAPRSETSSNQNSQKGGHTLRFTLRKKKLKTPKSSYRNKYNKFQKQQGARSLLGFKQPISSGVSQSISSKSKSCKFRKTNKKLKQSNSPSDLKQIQQFINRPKKYNNRDFSKSTKNSESELPQKRSISNAGPRPNQDQRQRQQNNYQKVQPNQKQSSNRNKSSTQQNLKGSNSSVNLIHQNSNTENYNKHSNQNISSRHSKDSNIKQQQHSNMTKRNQQINKSDSNSLTQAHTLKDDLAEFAAAQYNTSKKQSYSNNLDLLEDQKLGQPNMHNVANKRDVNKNNTNQDANLRKINNNVSTTRSRSKHPSRNQKSPQNKTSDPVNLQNHTQQPNQDSNRSLQMTRNTRKNNSKYKNYPQNQERNQLLDNFNQKQMDLLPQQQEKHNTHCLQTKKMPKNLQKKLVSAKLVKPKRSQKDESKTKQPKQKSIARNQKVPDTSKTITKQKGRQNKNSQILKNDQPLTENQDFNIEQLVGQHDQNLTQIHNVSNMANDGNNTQNVMHAATQQWNNNILAQINQDANLKAAFEDLLRSTTQQQQLSNLHAIQNQNLQTLPRQNDIFQNQQNLLNLQRYFYNVANETMPNIGQMGNLGGGLRSFNDQMMGQPQSKPGLINLNQSLQSLGSLSQLQTISKYFNQRNNTNVNGANLLPNYQQQSNVTKNLLQNLQNNKAKLNAPPKIAYNDTYFNNSNQQNAHQSKFGSSMTNNVMDPQLKNQLMEFANVQAQRGGTGVEVPLQLGLHTNLNSEIQVSNQNISNQKLKQLQKLAKTKSSKKNQEKDEEMNSRYLTMHEVGKGAFGSVTKAIDRRTQYTAKCAEDPYWNCVAIKKLFYDRRYEQRELSTLDEIKRNNLCANIIELKDRYFKKIMEKNQKKEYLFIVTDYLPYTICDLRVSVSTYSDDKSFEHRQNSPRNYCLESIRQVMYGVFQGLKDLHAIGITHRDIKLSNILIDNNQYPVKQVKICDLGSSKKLESDPNNESTKSLNYIGTRSFRAPELLVGNRYYNTKIDIWSAGIVFLKLILKYINKKAQMYEVNDTKCLSKVISDQIGEPTSVELKEMLATNNLMSTSVNNGISDTDIMKKRFKKLDALLKKDIPVDCIDILHKIFQLSPDRRITAEDALKHPYFAGCQEAVKKISSVQTKQSFVNRTTETTSPCTMTNMKAGQYHHNQ